MAASQLFASHGLLQGLKEIHTTSVATVALAFPEDAVIQDKEGTGFLVARSGDFSITACTWVHRKWPTTTPEGKSCCARLSDGSEKMRSSTCRMTKSRGSSSKTSGKSSRSKANRISRSSRGSRKTGRNTGSGTANVWTPPAQN